MIVDNVYESLKFDELGFNENSHIYTLKGNELPSVTTIMKPLSYEVYGGIDQDIMTKAAAKGTAVHQSIENYLCYGIADINSEYRSYFDAFLAFYHEYQPIPLATELRIYHGILMYAGTLDLLCKIDNKVVLIDYKTTAQLNPMLTRVQLEAYAKALESHEAKVDGKAILRLRKDGTYSLEWHELNDLEAWSTFTCLLTVRRYITKNRKGKGEKT